MSSRKPFIIFQNYLGIFVFIFLCSAFSQVKAQWNDVVRQSKNIGLGIIVKDNGVGFSLQQGKLTSHKDVQRLYSLDFTTIKHQREVKIVNQGAQNPRPFVYGKVTHNAIARLSFGVGKTVINPTQNNRLGVELIMLAGPSFAIQRPVYVDVMTFQVNDQLAIINSQRFDSDLTLNQNDIVGYTTGSVGWDELNFVPGVGFKPSVSFSWGSFETTLKQFQVGAIIDYFPTGLKIMAFGENPNTYLSPYLAFMWSFNR